MAKDCEMVYDGSADCATKCVVHGETAIVHSCGKASKKVDLRAFRAEVRALTPAQARALVKNLIGVYKEEIRRVNAKAAMEFDVGDKVTFKSKHGIRQTGVVRKVNKTTVSVKTDGDMVIWRVHPSFLKKVE